MEVRRELAIGEMMGKYETIRAYKRYRNIGTGIKLLISFSKIEFSNSTEGYYRLTKDIYISGLPFLLYVRKPKIDTDFESAKEKAKHVLLTRIEEEKYNLLSIDACLGKNECVQNEEMRSKVELLDQALSILSDS